MEHEKNVDFKNLYSTVSDKNRLLFAKIAKKNFKFNQIFNVKNNINDAENQK